MTSSPLMVPSEVDPVGQLLQSAAGDFQSSSHIGNGFSGDWNSKTNTINMPEVESHPRQENMKNTHLLESHHGQEVKPNTHVLESHHGQEVKQNIYPEFNTSSSSNAYVTIEANSYVDYSIVRCCEDHAQTLSPADGDQQNTPINYTYQTYHKQSDNSCRVHEDDNSDDSSSSDDNQSNDTSRADDDNDNQSNGTSRADDDNDNATTTLKAGKITGHGDTVTRPDDKITQPDHKTRRPADAPSDLHQLSEDTVEGILRTTDVTGTSDAPSDLHQLSEDTVEGILRTTDVTGTSDAPSDLHQLSEDTVEGILRTTDVTGTSDAPSDLHQLSEDTVEGILRTTDVTGTSDVRAIGLSNLDQLKSLNKFDPAIKRLLYSPKINATEARNTPIDSDIKTMVSDFLKTNVVGNFIISRVLRENYATFYGWLAAHLQCERNAWARRLKQALEMSEAIRREKTHLSHIVVETSSRLNTLVCDCSTSMHPTLSPVTNTSRDGDPLHGAGHDSLGAIHGIPGTVTESNRGLTTDIQSTTWDTAFQHFDKPRHENIDALESSRRDAPGDLRGAATQPITLDNRLSSTHRCHQTRTSDVESSKILSNETTKTFAESTLGGNARHERATLDQLRDMNVDWKDLLETRTGQLEDICYALITERDTCLKILGVQPHHCYSLVEALASYTTEKQNFEVIKRREIEERLCVLESENRKLIEEMSGLHATLLDKQCDALDLQKQLDKLDAVITSATSPRHNKCVGTNDGPVTRHRLGKLGPTLGNLDTSTSKLFRPNRDFRDSIYRVVKTVNKFTPNGQDASADSWSSQSKVCGSQSKNLTNTSPEEVAGRCTPPNEHLRYVRERSLMAISGEKLTSLKHRARQLEESLHDAISSLVTSRQPQTTPATEPVNSERCGQQLNRQGRLKGSTAQYAVVKRPASQRRSRSETILETEATSLLSGRSVTLAPHKTSDRYNVQSCLTVRQTDEQTSSPNNPAEALPVASQRVPTQSLNRILTDGQHPEASAKTFVGRHPRVISRHRAAGNMMVSKCLRCQKLFSAVDNHKMACLYHIKDKENVKYYDQSGKVTRVLVVWACCQQSQDTEGCCYGKHV